MVSMSLIVMIYLLSRRLSDAVGGNGEQGRQRKNENQNDVLNVVLCDKPELGTTIGATDPDDVR
jgi:hypothetical protein